jgi:hypothetical protein
MADPLVSNADIDQLADVLGRALLQHVAPDEADYYQEIIDAYRRNEFRRKTKAGDYPLAMGLGEIAALASPLIYDASKVVIVYLLQFASETAGDTVKESVKQIFAPRIAKWIESKFRIPPQFDLTPAKIDSVVAAVKDEMTKRSAPPELAIEIAASVQQALKPLNSPA